MTNLADKQEFDRYLAGCAAGQQLALAVIDFDNFRDLNAVEGRAVADGALAILGASMERIVEGIYGERGRVFRVGGDEFAVVLQSADAIHASAAVERARQQVGEAVQSLHGAGQNLTFSCGIACSPEHTDEIGELISFAGRALCHAKRSGRARTVMYAADLFDADAARESRLILRSIADALAAAVDAKDAYTHAHSRNVGDLSLYLARTMKLDDEMLADIALGALLHDIGKIGVSDHVLKKPGKLTREEWEEIKTHCEIGYAILDGIEGAERIREMVLYHHERPDGTGYPHGLSREEIPIAARIIGVADAFDSMTAERVYSRPRPPLEAIAEIVRLRGEQFDVDVVDALCELMVYEIDSESAQKPDLPPSEPAAFPRAA